MQSSLRGSNGQARASEATGAAGARIRRWMRDSARWIVPRARALRAMFGDWLWLPIAGRLLLWLAVFVALAHVGAGTVGRLIGLTPLRAAAAELASAALTAQPHAGERSAAVPSAPLCEPTGDPEAHGCQPPRPEPGDAGTDAGAAPARLPDGRVVLNLATTADLEALPGIGPKRAQAIVALRTQLGRFRRLEDLRRVRGIGPKAIARLRPLVVLDPPAEPPAEQ